MDTNSEAWRKECEIRFILRMSKVERAAYYLDVAKVRGRHVAKQLVTAVSDYWRENGGSQTT